MIADGTVHDKIWQEFYYIFINNMALCNSASSFHIDRKSKQFKMLIKNADRVFTFIYAFMRIDVRKSFQEPKHLLGSKNMSGIFSKRIVSHEIMKKKNTTEEALYWGKWILEFKWKIIYEEWINPICNKTLYLCCWHKQFSAKKNNQRKALFSSRWL